MKSWYTACASVTLLVAAIYHVIGIETVPGTQWALVAYVAGPILFLLLFALSAEELGGVCKFGLVCLQKWREDTLNYVAAFLFLVQGAWPLVFLHSVRSSNKYTLSSWRFVHFIDVFQTFGGEQPLDPIRHQAFKCVERLTNLKYEAEFRLKDGDTSPSNCVV